MKPWNPNYIKAPQKLRKQALQRDRYRCVQCGSSHSLEVDHVVNKARGGSDVLSNLQVLCSQCHWEKTKLEIVQAKEVKRRRRFLPQQSHPGLVNRYTGVV